MEIFFSSREEAMKKGANIVPAASTEKITS